MFEIKIDTSHINIYFAWKDVKKKISLKKPYRRNFYNTLGEYKYVLDNLPVVETSDKYKDAIWILWLQGEENAPEIVKKCIESVRYFHSDKQIIVLDLDSLKNYIEIPDYIQDKYSKGIIGHAHFSDYVRLCLLAKYGGTWIDSTLLLTDKLPDYMINSDMFMVKNANCFENLDYSIFNVYEKKKKFRLFPKKTKKTQRSWWANWYIHSEPNNRVILSVLGYFNEYWKKENCLKDYFMFHKFMGFTYDNDEKCREILDKMEQVPHTYAFLLHEFGKTPYIKETFDKIVGMSCIHKLTYRRLEKQDKQWLDRVYNLDFSKTKGWFKDFKL